MPPGQSRLAAPAPGPAPVAEPAPPRTGAPDDGLSRTMAIPRHDGAWLAAADAAGAPAQALALREPAGGTAQW